VSLSRSTTFSGLAADRKWSPTQKDCGVKNVRLNWDHVVASLRNGALAKEHIPAFSVEAADTE